MCWAMSLACLYINPSAAPKLLHLTSTPWPVLSPKTCSKFPPQLLWFFKLPRQDGLAPRDLPGSQTCDQFLRKLHEAPLLAVNSAAVFGRDTRAAVRRRILLPQLLHVHQTQHSTTADSEVTNIHTTSYL